MVNVRNLRIEANIIKMELRYVLVVIHFVILTSQTESVGKCVHFKNCLNPKQKPGIIVVCKQDVNTRDNDFDYNFLNYQWNLLVPKIYPLAYFLPTTTKILQAGVRCANRLNIRIVPKSGGHGYEKYGFGDKETIVIDLRRMSNIKINSASITAHIQAGALNGPLAETLYLNGNFVLPNGQCPTVGMAYALGGGYSLHSRKYGLMIDNILEMTMIGWNGTKYIANSETNSDLFFALRGAGGGSFGVVTKFKFRIFEAPAQVVYGKRTYTIKEFPSIFDNYQKFAEKTDLPPNINTRMTVKDNEILVEIYHLLDKSEQSSETVKKLLNGELFPASKSAPIVKVLSFHEYLVTVGTTEESAGGIEKVTRRSFVQKYFRGTSFYAAKAVDSNGVDAIDAVVQKISKYVDIQFPLLGGAIDDVDASEMAYVHRKGNIYKVNADYDGDKCRTKKQQRRALKWQKEFFVVTKQVINHTESYQNNPDPNLDDFLQRYYGANLGRIMEVKQKYDPHNVFYNPQSVPLH